MPPSPPLRLLSLVTIAVAGVAFLASTGESSPGQVGPPPPTSRPAASPATRDFAFSRSPDRNGLDAALERKLPEFVLDAVPLGEALEQWEGRTHVRVVVRWDAIGREGIAPPAQVTVRLFNVRAAKALQQILAAAGELGLELHQSVEEGRIVVTMFDDYAARNTFERRYDVRRLIAVTKRPHGELMDGLAQLIRDTVTPGHWAETGGYPGKIRVGNGILYITQTADAHQGIQNLIEQMGETIGLHPPSSDEAPSPTRPGP